MQKNIQKIGQDTKVELKTVTVTEMDLVENVGMLGLTADKIAAVINRQPGKFDIVYANGFTIDTKANMRRVDYRAPMLISTVAVMGYIFYETVDDEKVGDFAGILRPLATLKDNRDKPAVDLFFVGFARNRFAQHVLTPDNTVVTLAHADAPGIASIRYDRHYNRLIGIRRDVLGNDAIVALGLDAIKRDPQSLTDPNNWRLIAQLDKVMPIYSLSRPKTVGNQVKFVVNFEKTAALLTLANRDEAVWGESFKTTEIQIGHLAGSHDLLVGYDVTEKDVWISVTRAVPNHPTAKYLA